MKKIFLISLGLSIIIITNGQQKKYLDSFLNVLATTKDDTTKVIAMAKISFYHPNLDTSITMAEQGLILARKIRFLKGEAMCLSQLGNCFYGTSDYPKAFDYFLQSLKINQKINYPLGIASALRHIGKIKEVQGDDQAALNYLHQAAAIDQMIHNDNIASNFHSISSVFVKMNLFDSALFYAQRAYEARLAAKDQTQMSVQLMQLGIVHSKLNHEALAMDYYKMAINNTQDPGAWAEIYYNVAVEFKKQSNIDSATFYGEKALNLGRYSKQPDVIMNSGILLSQLYEGKNSDKALLYYKTAMAIRDSIYSKAKLLQIQALDHNEQERQKEIAETKIKEDEQRKLNLQYAIIVISLITFVILFLLLSRSIIVKTKFIEFFGILGLLAVFEFINLFIHPYLAHVTNDSHFLLHNCHEHSNFLNFVIYLFLFD